MRERAGTDNSLPIDLSVPGKELQARVEVGMAWRHTPAVSMGVCEQVYDRLGCGKLA